MLSWNIGQESKLVSLLCLVPCLGLIVLGYVYGTGLWGDLIIDYGRELYIPWAISNGKSLYLDVMNYFGPVSSYLNAAVFYTLGVSIKSIQTFNCMLLCLQCILIHIVVVRLSGKFVSVVCTVFFVLFTGLNINEFLRNYNYIAPYSHELMHGILASFAFIVLVMCRDNSMYKDCLAGLLFGCVAILKSEVFIALGFSFATYVFFSSRFRVEGRLYLKRLVPILASATIPIASVFVYFSCLSSVGEAFEFLSRMYVLPFNPPQVMRVFFSATSGGGNVVLRMGLMVCSFACVAMLFIFFYKLNTASGLSSLGMVVVSVLSSAVMILVYAYVVLKINKLAVFATSFLPLALCATLFLLTMFKLWGWGRESEKVALLASVISFSLCIALKVVLNVNAQYYSTFLAMPGFVFFIVVSVWYVALVFPSRNIYVKWTYFPVAVIIYAVLFPGVKKSLEKYVDPNAYHMLQYKDDMVRVGKGRAGVLEDVITFLDRERQSGDTLAVIPEGVGLNYLLRMPNPTPYINLAPPEWFVFGGGEIMKAYEKSAPDWVVLLHRSTPEYGIDYFGVGYAQDLNSWIVQSYECMRCTEHAPFGKDGQYGACIYKVKQGVKR